MYEKLKLKKKKKNRSEMIIIKLNLFYFIKYTKLQYPFVRISL